MAELENMQADRIMAMRDETAHRDSREPTDWWVVFAQFEEDAETPPIAALTTSREEARSTVEFMFWKGALFVRVLRVGRAEEYAATSLGEYDALAARG